MLRSERTYKSNSSATTSEGISEESGAATGEVAVPRIEEIVKMFMDDVPREKRKPRNKSRQCSTIWRN